MSEIKEIIAKELDNNPVIDEIESAKRISREQKASSSIPFPAENDEPDMEFNFISKKESLQEFLLRQLGVCACAEDEFRVAQEIIGNIDDNGYLAANLKEITQKLGVPMEVAQKALFIVQQFEPAGVGARTPAECLLIQLEYTDYDPVLKDIIEGHLDNLAKKDYKAIARALKIPLEKVESLCQKVLKLNPKPGRNYSIDMSVRIRPDVVLELDDEENIEIRVNDEDLPTLNINNDYKQMLKDKNLDAKTRDFITQKLRQANELLAAISKRQATLRKIVEAVVEIQKEAIRNEISDLKPLTFAQLAKQLQIHETTVCRAVMNKYVKTPSGLFALKKFFPHRLKTSDGKATSTTHAKRLIAELIEDENKKHPLSDKNIRARLLHQHNLNISRRTVTKYREELRILSSAFRKER